MNYLIVFVGAGLGGALRHAANELGEAPQVWRLFLATGVLGGFTTFSAFSLDVVLLYERGALLQAALYVGLSVALSVAGLVFGLWILRQGA